MSMLAANHWTEHRDPKGGFREGLKELEGPFLVLMGGDVLGPKKA